MKTQFSHHRQIFHYSHHNTTTTAQGRKKQQIKRHLNNNNKQKKQNMSRKITLHLRNLWVIGKELIKILTWWRNQLKITVDWRHDAMSWRDKFICGSQTASWWLRMIKKCHYTSAWQNKSINLFYFLFIVHFWQFQLVVECKYWIWICWLMLVNVTHSKKDLMEKCLSYTFRKFLRCKYCVKSVCRSRCLPNHCSI